MTAPTASALRLLWRHHLHDPRARHRDQAPVKRPVTARASRSVDAELAVLTGAKAVSNTALRWLGPFLPTLERAFGTSVATLTGVMGVFELGGLSTTLTGPLLDRGHERTVFRGGLALVAVSSVVALWGNVTAFAASFLLLILGVGNLTSAGHAWIGHRVPFAARGRSIGLFEMSWAVSLLVGAPIVALLIHQWGWRGPYVALAIASVAALLAVGVFVGPTHLDQPTVRAPRRAAAFGVASGARLGSDRRSRSRRLRRVGDLARRTSRRVDRRARGDRRDVRRDRAGLVGDGRARGRSHRHAAHHRDGAGGRVRRALVIVMSGGSRALAVLGLLTFLSGFELAFVSSLTLLTEAAPEARGKAIGIGNAVGTIARCHVGRPQRTALRALRHARVGHVVGGRGDRRARPDRAPTANRRRRLTQPARRSARQRNSRPVEVAGAAPARRCTRSKATGPPG